MGRINRLTGDVFNKISAGEVVERPASVVKELVENCIDAEASRVTIAIKGGGTSFIEVSDNGCGIAEDDIEAAFTNHATSKLKYAEDLEKIATLGFRGEALASISAVAHVEVVTRTPTADMGLRVLVENGEVVKKEYCSANVGTKITITDLFFNTPARKKFLKSPAREQGEISQYVSKLILTNPLLEVTYIIDGKTVYNFAGNGLEEAIFTVYGRQCLEHCIAINSSYGNVVVKGYIGAPDYTKPNSTYQTISVNGRLVKDITISTAAKQAFMPFLMTRQYPFFVIDVQLPYEMIDVNVHPNKLEVRFQNSREIFFAVSVPIKDALRKYTESKSEQLMMGSDENVRLCEIEPTEAPKNVFVNMDEQQLYKNIKQNDVGFTKDDYVYIDTNNKEEYRKFLEDIDKLSVADILERRKERERLELEQNKPHIQAKLDEICSSETAYYRLDDFEEKKEKQDNSYIDFEKVHILGVAFDTYLVLQIDDQLILVDQHAAHERLLYDKFMQKGVQYMQMLMVPYVFKVTPKEAEFLEYNSEVLQKVGFDIKPFGKDTFRVNEVSSLFVDSDIKKFVDDLLSMVDDIKIDDKQLLKDKLAQKACKAAVKAGERLNDTEIEYIVRSILENKVLQCPHGRPITVALSETQLKKMFKRIV